MGTLHPGALPHWADTVFTAERWSQSPGSHIAAYFLNGASYQIQLKPPAFDQSLLSSPTEPGDTTAAFKYRFVEVPEGAGAAAWHRQMERAFPVTDDNRARHKREVTFVAGTPPPAELPSSGTRCIHHHAGCPPHQRAVAWTWQYDIPDQAEDGDPRQPYNGFAGYCARCLQESYGITINQVGKIFGLG